MLLAAIPLGSRGGVEYRHGGSRPVHEHLLSEERRRSSSASDIVSTAGQESAAAARRDSVSDTVEFEMPQTRAIARPDRPASCANRHAVSAQDPMCGPFAIPQARLESVRLVVESVFGLS